MRKEFMLYIRNNGDGKAGMSPATHLAFVQQCEKYIGQLKANDQLIAAQPLLREGVLLSKTAAGWNQQAVDTSGEVQVGYYHIIAADLEAAIEIAKANPEFEYVPSASIELRPVKMKEAQTSFEYPSGPR